VKLLRDDSTEHFQSLLTILFAKNLPEVLQGDPLVQSRPRRKKTPSWLSCMGFLLEWCCVWLRANRRVSRARRQIIPGSLAKGQCSQVCGSSVCSFWGDSRQLDKFLQAYAAEKVKIEGRRKGHVVTEQQLVDGSIKLTVQIGGAA